MYVQDKSYLRPYIDEVAAEFAERGQFDNIKVTPRHQISLISMKTMTCLDIQNVA